MITVWKCVQVECDKMIAEDCKFRFGDNDPYEPFVFSIHEAHTRVLKKHMKKYKLYKRSHGRIICELCKQEIITKYNKRKELRNASLRR